MEYRVEKKYLCTDYQLQILHGRLRDLLAWDENQKGESYCIRSVYFDTWKDDCYYENAAGVARRSKYRIRTYDNNPETIKLEIKEKWNSYIKKLSSKLTREECDHLLDGGKLDIPEENEVRNRVALLQRTELLKPVLLVEYERTAYVYKLGNVRITFDRNISASNHVQDFFSDQVHMTPILQPNLHVLEVKYDEFLPDYIRNALDIGTLRQTAFSKYYLGRQALDNTGKLNY